MNLQTDLGSIVGSIIEEKLSKEKIKKRDMSDSLKEGRYKGIKVIAEIKPSSPSKGELRSINLENIGNIVKDIESGGASAISVLVEPRKFNGSMEFLKEVRRSTELPILAKGFFYTPIHLSECAVFGADAYLSMIRVLEVLNVNKKDFIQFSEKLGLESFFEANSLEEIKSIPPSKRRIVEINNRNIYEDFEIHLDNIAIGKNLPEEDVLVSGSGISSAKDLETLFYLSNGRLDAVLIGTSIMNSEDIRAKVSEFVEKGKEVVK